MTVSSYFNHYNYTPTQDLVKDLVDEVIQLRGYDFTYIPRTWEGTKGLDEVDYLFGENVQPKFDTSYVVEMYPNNVDFYGQEATQITKFGLEVRDTMELVVSKRRFAAVTGITSPKEGDLIFFPMFRFMFQIDYVELEQPFYNFGTNYVFVLTCSVMNYNNEKIQTGNTNVDQIADIYHNEGNVDNNPFANNVELEDEANDYFMNTTNPFGTP